VQRSAAQCSALKHSATTNCATACPTSIRDNSKCW
jgi:hypothetical protein